MRAYTCRNEKDTYDLAYKIGLNLPNGTIVSLEGPLGAGKTVFVRGIARALGINQPVTSPSYTLISTYSGKIKLHHIDLYRILSIEELQEIGFEETINGDDISVIEWGEKAGHVLPDNAVRVIIKIKPDFSRHITITKNERISHRYSD